MPERAPSAARGRGVYLGRMGGIPVYLAPSWFLLAVVVVVAYGRLLARTYLLSGISPYAGALLFAVLLAGSVLLHELGHGLTARAFRWPVQQIRLSVMGGHTSFDGATATPGRSAVVAVAGPVCNLLLALLCQTVLVLLAPAGMAGSLLSLLAWANLLVGGFNLLPGIPLDGGRAVEALVWKATGSRLVGTRAGALLGGAVAVALMSWLVLSGAWHSFSTVVLVVVVTVHLASSAWQAWKAAGFRFRVEQLRLDTLARPVEWVPSEQPLVQFGSRPRAPESVLCVADDHGRILGLVDPRAREEAESTGHVLATARQLCAALPDRPRLPEGASGPDLFRTVAEQPGPGCLVGPDVLPSRIVLQSDLLRALDQR